MTRAASAPGKLVLTGEYAVLDGAPAIAMAVDVRARVSVAPGTGVSHALSSPGYAAGEHRFTVNAGGGFRWDPDAPDYCLLEQAWIAAGVPALPPLTLVLDTSGFSDAVSAGKYGLGSSAALATALHAVLTGREGAIEEIVAIHRACQGGKGSGVDVAAACCGGVIAYRMHDCSVRQLQWPVGLHFAVLWSGLAASTTGKLGEFQAADTHNKRRKALSSASRRMARRWPEADVRTLLAMLADYCEVLSCFDEDLGLDIFGAGHGELRDHARDFGVVYKPCGAGGGDVGIVLSDDQERVDDFVRMASACGFSLLDIGMDNRGVTMSSDKS